MKKVVLAMMLVAGIIAGSSQMVFAESADDEILIGNSFCYLTSQFLVIQNQGAQAAADELFYRGDGGRGGIPGSGHGAGRTHCGYRRHPYRGEGKGH